MRCTILYNPADPIIQNTKPEDMVDLLTKEAVAMVQDDTIIQSITGGGGWIVKMRPVDGEHYLCVITHLDDVLHRVDLRPDWDAIQWKADLLLHCTPSSDVGRIIIEIDDGFVERKLDQADIIG